MRWADGPDAHRGTRAIQRLVEYAPSTGGMALWMAHRDVDEDAIPGVIATDGRCVFYAPGFERLGLEQQTGWVAHEMLHVAFRHVPRLQALRGMLGEVDDKLFNACADALVNSTLSHLSWLALPPRAVTLRDVLAKALQSDEPEEKALLEWDVERLYRAIDDRQKSQDGQGQRSKNQQDGGRDAAENSQGSGPGRDGPRAATMRSLASSTLRDLLPSGAGEAAEDAAELDRTWAERLTRGHAEDGAFSMLRSLGADVPRSRVPWQQILRVRMMRGLLRQPEQSWSRPSRSWLANRGRTAGGRRMPWEPGIVSTRQVPRLALLLDVSGSIDDALLARFAGEINAISRHAGAVIILIIGDDQVRSVEEFAPGTLVLPEVDGGGGTHFEPLLTEAVRRRADLVVVLTDLQGDAGPNPGLPVHWVVPPAWAYAEVPFGQRLVLNDG